MVGVAFATVLYRQCTIQCVRKGEMTMEWFYITGWCFFGLVFLSMIVNIFDGRLKAPIVAIDSLISAGCLVWILYAMNLVR